jgi:C_GCAxxG_C_C family probable redox protein
MSNLQKSAELFGKGYNCAQSVLAASASGVGIDEGTALKIASGFAAGMGYRGEMCGAVVGAYIAIGLKYGFTDPDGQDKKDQTYKLIGEFLKDFLEKNGSVYCNKLLDYDLSDPEQLRKAREQNVFREKCPKFVQDSSEILEKILRNR